MAIVQPGRARRRRSIGTILSSAAAIAAPLVITQVVKADPPANPVIGSGGTFNITSPQFGTSGSTSGTDWSGAIVSAFNTCVSAGGGTVLIPSGTYVSQSFVLSGGGTPNGNGVNFDIASGGLLQYAPRASDPNNATITAFITWTNAKNCEITGSGAIDGQGGVGGASSWWSNSGANRPDLIHFSNASTLLVNGITVYNSPEEHFSFGGTKTNDITFNNVTVSAPGNSPNTDGIDPNGTDWVIENSTIACGDDNIAVKSGTSNTLTANVTITNMTFGTGHGLSIGGQTPLGVMNMTVTNCTFNGTTNGLRLKAGRTNGGLVSNISYSNITMTNVANPIYITSWYLSNGDNQPSNAAKAEANNVTFTAGQTPQWNAISFNNVTATGATNGIIIYGLPEAPVGQVTFNNVNISGTQKAQINFAGFNGNSATFNSVADPNYQVLFENSTLNGTALTLQSQTTGSLFSQPNTGNVDAVITIAPVPEPATISMALLAPSLLLMRNRRRSGNASTT
jgi:polygalacturonase